MPELPDEVLQRIFALLDDPAHLLQCSAVSRSWHRAVSHGHVFETLYRLRWGAVNTAPLAPAPPAAAAAAADADAVDAPTTHTPADDELAWLGLDGGGGWRKAAMFRGREELSVVGILAGLTLVHFSAQLERFPWDRGCIQGLFRWCLGGILDIEW